MEALSRGAARATLVDRDTRLLVQGLTGSEGRFFGLRNRDYGTTVVAGVTPGKGGQEVDEVRTFDFPIELEPWLERTACTGEDAVRVRELLADRIRGGDVVLDRIALRAEVG